MYDYNARYYSAVLGRFVSPDTIVPEPANPQDWNRYTYVRDNPLVYTDPTGHDADCGINCEEESDVPLPPPPEEDEEWERALGYDSDLSYESYRSGRYYYHRYRANPQAYASDLALSGEAASYRQSVASIYAEYGLGECLECIINSTLDGGLAEAAYSQGDPMDILGVGGGSLGASGGGGVAATIINWKRGGKNFKLVDGASMTTDQALDTATNYLGPGYQDMGNGRFLSADGTHQVRMGDSDITGKHGGGPHMNFEKLGPNPAKPGKMQIQNNVHIYLTDP